MSSLPIIIEIKKKAPSIFMRKKRAPAPQQLGRETPLASREIGELCLPLCRQEQNSFLSSSGVRAPNHPHLLFETWKRACDREERTELFQTSNLTREVRSSPRPAKGNKKALYLILWNKKRAHSEIFMVREEKSSATSW